MHLLLATGLFPPEIGGLATYAKLLEERLPKEGIEVTVLPFSTVRAYKPIIRHFVYAWNIAQLAKNTDIILVQDSVSTGVPAALVATIMRKKLIVRVPGDYAWEQGSQRFGVKDSLDEFQKKSYGLRIGFLRFLQRFTVNRATRIIAPSEYLGRIVQGWTENHISVIYNGINTAKTKAEREKDLIVSAGRLVPWKGFDTLIEIVKKHPEWRLAIIGDGPDKQRLESMIEGKQIQVISSLPNSELRQYLAKAAVFVLNSRYEGLSHILLEACAEGAPIIATNVGGNPEVVREGSGVLVDADASLERELERLLKDESLREQYSESSISRANVFSIDIAIKKTAELIKTV